jgi:hypothetical protein
VIASERLEHSTDVLVAAARFIADGDPAEEARIREWIAAHPLEAWEAIGVGIEQLEAQIPRP